MPFPVGKSYMEGEVMSRKRGIRIRHVVLGEGGCPRRYRQWCDQSVSCLVPCGSQAKTNGDLTGTLYHARVPCRWGKKRACGNRGKPVVFEIFFVCNVPPLPVCLHAIAAASVLVYTYIAAIGVAAVGNISIIKFRAFLDSWLPFFALLDQWEKDSGCGYAFVVSGRQTLFVALREELQL